MPASDGLNDLLAGFFGARRQGKTTQVKVHLAAWKLPRVMIFDPMNEYAEQGERVSSLKELNAAVRTSSRYAYRYVPPIHTDEDMLALPARFEGFCSIAFDVGDLTTVNDELHLVTKASWAPPAWKRCLTMGGHQGVRIVAVSHRPAQVDKVFFSLCNLVSTCRLNFEDDVATLKNVLGVDAAEIAQLLPYQCIVRDMTTGVVHRGGTRDGPIGRSRRPSRPASAPPPVRARAKKVFVP